MTPAPARKSFGTKLKELMEAQRIGGADLARSVGSHHSIVNRWMNDEGWPRAPMLLEIARRLAVPVEYLIDEAMESPPAAAAPEPPPIAPHLIRIVRGLGEEEAERRLLLAPPRPAPDAYGAATALPVVTEPAPPPTPARPPAPGGTRKGRP